MHESVGASQGDEFDLGMGNIAHGGYCVARLDGRVVFVRGALPGRRSGSADRHIEGFALVWTGCRRHLGRFASRCSAMSSGGRVWGLRLPARRC